MNFAFRRRMLALLVAVPTAWTEVPAEEQPARTTPPEASKKSTATGDEASGVPLNPDKSAPETGPAVLPEVVVTATRTAEAVNDLPQSVTVVTAEAIERRQPQTPNEMLREEPGIWSVQVPVQGSPIIRGQIGNRVLYLWDGIRINNGALFAGPNGFFNQFPVGAVERMEVIRGPGSVQYGSDAIGGVSNIISKRSDYFPTQLSYGGEAYARYGTVDGELTDTADFWLAQDRFNVMGGLTSQSVGDYRGPGVGVIPNTGFGALGGYLNLAFKPLDNQTLRLSWIQNDRDDVETYAQSKLNPSGVPRFFSPYEQRGLAKLDYEMDDLGSLSSELRAYTYLQYYNSSRERLVETTPALVNTLTDTAQHIFGGGIQNTTPWANGWGDPRLISGLDYRVEDLGSALTQYQTTKSTGATVGSVPAGKVPNGTYDVFDLFTMLEAHPLERWTVSTGGRFERTHLHADPNALDVIPNAGYTLQDLMLDKVWYSATWNAGSVYSLTRELDWAADIATGFRAPTFSDTLSTGPPVFSSKIASLPSPNVMPEQSITYEAGPRYHTERWNASLTAYWTELTDVIRPVTSGTVVIPGQGTFIARTSNNAGQGYVRGIEFAASYKPHRDWTLFGNATYTEGRDTQFNEYYRFIPF